MPLIHDGQSYTKIEFEENKELCRFVLKSDNTTNALYFDYSPVVDTSFTEADYEVYLFENRILNAENDVFMLYERFNNGVDDTRIGWVFPIAVLESNESVSSGNKHLHGYKYVAFHKLLATNTNIARPIELQVNQSGNYLLSEIYGDDSIIVILNKKQIRAPAQLNKYSFIPSLSQFGYFIKNEFKINHDFDIHKQDCVNQRGNTRLNVRRSAKKYTDEEYFSELYSQYFKTISEPLLKFHLTYQVIEHMICKLFDSNFDDVITKYQENKIQKNDFIEKINEIRKERVSVRNVFQKYKDSKSSNTSRYLADLSRDCIDLLDPHTELKTNEGDLVYDVRNLLVHNYRKLNQTERQKVTQINVTLELIISDFLLFEII